MPTRQRRTESSARRAVRARRPDRRGVAPAATLARTVAAALAMLAAALVVDAVVAGIGPTDERPPSFAPLDLLRSSLALVAAAVLVAGVVGAGARTDARAASHRPRGAASAPLPPRDVRIAAVVIAGALAATALCVTSPGAYSLLAREGGPVETASAWLLFACAGVLAATARMLWTRGARLRAMLTLAGAIVVAVVGGEEVSWFQRVLQVETPAWMAGNGQAEMNLHNFATDFVEAAYYLAAWAALVLLPFACDHLPPTGRAAPLRLLVPGRTMVATAAPMAAFAYLNWSQVTIQFSVFATLLILLHYLRTSRHAGERWLMAASMAAVAAIQIAYLAAGGAMVRNWDESEYREFFIALLLAVAAVGLRIRVRHDDRSAVSL